VQAQPDRRNTLPDDLQTLKWAQEIVLGDISRSALQHMQSYAEHMGVYDLSFLGTAYMYPLSFPLKMSSLATVLFSLSYNYIILRSL
jgi:hypothetical protein